MVPLRLLTIVALPALLDEGRANARADRMFISKMVGTAQGRLAHSTRAGLLKIRGAAVRHPFLSRTTVTKLQ